MPVLLQRHSHSGKALPTVHFSIVGRGRRAVNRASGPIAGDHPISPRPRRLFRAFQQEIDAAFDVRIAVLVEMQLGDMPEAQAAGQFVTEIMPGVLQGVHGLLLLPLGARGMRP